MRRLLLVVLLAAACSATPPADTSAPTPSTTPSTSTSAPATDDGTTMTTSPQAATTTTSTVPIDQLRLAFEVVADGFQQPGLVTHAGDDRLFVVDQPGYIWVIDGGDPELFLDITEDVSFEGERGFLGLAFHPDYADNGRFYVDYTDRSGDTKIVEFTVSADVGSADPGSARTILTIDQPAANHNGGMILFGPDGSLWIGMGDGGASDDRFGNGQRGDTLLGAMLRIDVGPGIEPYGTPSGNDFSAPEVWAIGLRNPWRFAFDGDDLWIADVGQNDIEEVNRVGWAENGLNFGWPIMEGSACFQSATCDGTGLVVPVTEYSHDAGCSVTGGFVYRGASIPQLAGHYLYSDYCSGILRSITASGDEYDWTDQMGTIGNVTSFGTDAAGRLYVSTMDGVISRLASE